MRQQALFHLIIWIICIFSSASWAKEDPLPAWREGTVKDSIIQFVSAVTDPDSPGFIETEDRIAVFDNDGTLMSKVPYMIMLDFSLHKIREQPKTDIALTTKQPYQAIIEGDHKAIAAFTKLDWYHILKRTQAGLTNEAYEKEVAAWISQAKNSATNRRHLDMVYLPMLQLLAYLEAHGFTNYVATGSNLSFMRPWVKAVYNIDKSHVIGSTTEMQYRVTKDGNICLDRKDDVKVINVGAEKVIGIDQHIGRRPIFAAGNSDGDYEMLLWTSTHPKSGLSILIHHTDEVREFKYDREHDMSTLKRGLEDADKNSWVVVDMKEDWLEVFP